MAWLRVQPRPMQALIAGVALAVLAGVIGIALYLVGQPGDPQGQIVAQVAPEPQAQAAETVQPTVPPPAEARPRPLSLDDEPESAEVSEPAVVVAASPAEEPPAAREPSGIRHQDSWLRSRLPGPRLRIGGGTHGAEEFFDGGRPYMPAPLDEARRAIRAYIGADPLDPLPMSFTYAVRRGDNMASIAQRFGLQIGSVRINNMHVDDPNVLQLDAELEIPVRDGLLYTVQSGDTLDGLVLRYNADKRATITFELNALIGDPDAIRIDQRLLLVGGTRPDLNGAYFAPLTARVRWHMPVKYDRITDPYGTPRNNLYGIHTGVDFTADYGAPVRAARAGKVMNSGYDSSYGYWVEIDHQDGLESRYAHLSSISASVSLGGWVQMGQVIGWVGSTGYSTGPHLHFEILRDNLPINPHPALGLS